MVTCSVVCLEERQGFITIFWWPLYLFVRSAEVGFMDRIGTQEKGCPLFYGTQFNVMYGNVDN